MPALTDLAAKATVLLLVASLVVALMRRASAAARHLVWTSALGATLLLPIGRLAMPAFSLPIIPAVVTGPAATSAVEAPPTIEPSIGARTSESIAAPISAAPAPVPPPSRWPVWTTAQILVALWLAGVAILTLRGAAGLVGIRRLTRRSHRADDPGLLARVQQVTTDLDIRRPVITLIASSDSIPVTWGVVYPTLLLPLSAGRWRAEHPDRLDAVLVHELGHVTRLDALSDLIARLAVAVLWFHPLAWVAARRARVEREKACDDLVLGHGSLASRYADDLLTLVQSLTPPASAAAGALAMARRSQFEGRLLAILDAGANRRGLSGGSIGVAAAVLGLMLPLAAARAVPRGLPVSLPTDRVAAPLGQPDSSRDPFVAAELDKLQGTWNVVSLETNGAMMPPAMLAGAQIIVSGSRFTTRGMGVSYAGTLSLDLTDTPKKLDLHYTEGPNQGSASLAIYDIDARRWRICLSLAGDTRPVAFIAPVSSGFALEMLERASDPSPAAAAQSSAADAEMAKLGGDWTVVSIESSGQKIPESYLQGGTRVMRGSEVTVTVAGQVQVQATMKIDPSKSPKAFDYLLTGGPDAGKTALGIYDLAGDILKTNFAPAGQPRPTDFTTKAGDGRTSSVWKRKTQTEHAVPNLAGAWVPRDPERNRRLFAVGLTGIGSGGMTIGQDARTLTIARVISDEMSREHAVTGFPATTVLNLDGSPSTLQGWSYARTFHARWDGDRLAVTTTTTELEWTDYYSLENGDLKVETAGRNDVVVFYKRAQAPPSIAGSWRLAFQNVPTLPFTLAIALDGTRVTATLRDVAGVETGLTGELVGGTLKLASPKGVDGNWSSYSGELRADGTLAGTAISHFYDSQGNEVNKKTEWLATRASVPRPESTGTTGRSSRVPGAAAWTRN